MIGFPAVIRVFVAVGASDLRRGFDGLAQLARDQLEQDPMTGHLFVFANRKRDRIKILYWDQSGFAIWMKRLEQGRFNWPASDAVRVEWSSAELAAVLGGIDLKETRKRKRFALAAS
jgi:transposase